jgi:hypothetical protein
MRGDFCILGGCIFRESPLISNPNMAKKSFKDKLLSIECLSHQFNDDINNPSKTLFKRSHP